MNNFLYIADVIDFQCFRIANIQGQQRVSGRPSAATGYPRGHTGACDQEEDDKCEEEESLISVVIYLICEFFCQLFVYNCSFYIINEIKYSSIVTHCLFHSVFTA